jgi:aspartate kinase
MPCMLWECFNLVTPSFPKHGAVCTVQEITPRAKDSLVSFGERLSTRLLAGYLCRLGVPAKQFDAWRLGLTTTCEFTDAQVKYSCMPAIKEAIAAHFDEHKHMVPVVTGFLGKAEGSGTVLIAMLSV